MSGPTAKKSKPAANKSNDATPALIPDASTATRRPKRRAKKRVTVEIEVTDDEAGELLTSCTYQLPVIALKMRISKWGTNLQARMMTWMKRIRRMRTKLQARKEREQRRKSGVMRLKRTGIRRHRLGHQLSVVSRESEFSPSTIFHSSTHTL